MLSKLYDYQTKDNQTGKYDIILYEGAGDA